MTNKFTKWFPTEQQVTALEGLGVRVSRYGLAFLLTYIGVLKFFPFEANAIRGFIENSPFMSWMYAVLSVQQTSNVIGFVEVTAGLALFLRSWFPQLALLASAVTVPMFLSTLSFFLTTPGVAAPDSIVGQFLLKDIVLLGASFVSAAEIVKSLAQQSEGRKGNLVPLKAAV